MVKIHFHSGIHRSGTSSIQYVLRQRFGAENPSDDWYPVGSALGDSNGHGGLAQHFDSKRGSYDLERGLAEFAEIRAKAEGCRSLIISSENFSYAKDEDLRAIRELLRDDDLHLVITAAPLRKRAVSLWTAQVQFGGIADIHEAMTSIVTHEIFNPNFFDRMIDSLDPNSATLIVTDPGKPPETLLVNFLSSCDLPVFEGDLSAADVQKKNRSPGFWETEMIRQFNLIFKSAKGLAARSGVDALPSMREYHEARKKLQALLKTGEWSAAVVYSGINLPEEYDAPMAEIGRRTRERVIEHVDSGRLKVVGDLDVLFEGIKLE